MSAADSLFSVIIPTFNRGALTRRSVASVRAQSYPNYEIVIVDDASTDDTLEIVSALQDDKLRIVSLAKNKGVSGARNAGAEQARGRYVVFLDSDDEMLPEALAAYAAVIAEHPDVELIWGGYQGLVEQDDGQQTPGRIDMVSSNSYKPGAENLMYAAKLGACCGLCMPRERYLAFGGFDESLRLAEDRDFFIRARQAGLRHASVDQVLIYRHMHKGESLARNLSREKLESIHAYNETVIDKHAGYLARPENTDLMVRLSQVLVNRYYKMGDTRRARDHAGRILRRQPLRLKIWLRVLRYELKNLFRGR